MFLFHLPLMDQMRCCSFENYLFFSIYHSITTNCYVIQFNESYINIYFLLNNFFFFDYSSFVILDKKFILFCFSLYTFSPFTTDNFSMVLLIIYLFIYLIFLNLLSFYRWLFQHGILLYYFCCDIINSDLLFYFSVVICYCWQFQ